MPTLKRHREEKIPRRDPFRHIYQSARWHRHSTLYLKSNRLCVNCLKQGKTVVSRVTDHKVPMTAGGDIWSPDNHQALCFTCHAIKTKEERKQ